MTLSPPLLEITDVSRTFGRVVAIRRASLRVAAGTVVALLGDNGAGKSTLVKLIQGFHQPTSGQIAFEGQAIRMTSPAMARSMGIETVPQDLGLVSMMSIYRNFFLGREQTGRWGFLDHAAMRAQCRSALADMGIDIRDPDEPVGSLSGGERQAIAISRAEHFGAQLVILDEPTSALSVKQTQRVLDYILAARQRGLAVIFITHNMFHAYAVADQFTVMRRGESVVENVDRSEVDADLLGQLVMGTTTINALRGGP